MMRRVLVLACLFTACGDDGEPPVSQDISAVRSALTQPGIDVTSTCYLLRANPDCPAPLDEKPGDIVDQVVLGGDAAVISCDFTLPLWRLASEGPTRSYCARIVHRAADGAMLPASDVADWRASLGGAISGLPLGHQDAVVDGKSTFMLRPYDRLKLEFGALRTFGPAGYDPDGDRVPNLDEVKLRLRPYDVDDMDPPHAMVSVDGEDNVTFGTAAENGGLPNESPAVVITRVEGLVADPTEATNRQYRVCMGRLKADGSGPECSVPALDEGSPNPHVLRQDSERVPVVGITHRQATEFCNARGMRLPSEIEWEFLARRGEASTYPWGETSDLEFALMLALHDDRNPCELGRFTLYTPVESFPRYCASTPLDVEEVMDADGNPRRPAQSHGLRDLAGNAAEWVADTYVKDAHEMVAPAQNTPIEVAGVELHVVKGGSFWSGPRFVRTYARVGVADSEVSVTTLGAIGVRCVKPR